MRYSRNSHSYSEFGFSALLFSYVVEMKKLTDETILVVLQTFCNIIECSTCQTNKLMRAITRTRIAKILLILFSSLVFVLVSTLVVLSIMQTRETSLPTNVYDGSICHDR
jgi:hypothetical protein